MRRWRIAANFLMFSLYALLAGPAADVILETEYGFFVRDDHALTFKQIADVKGYVVGVYGPSSTNVRCAGRRQTLEYCIGFSKKLVDESNATWGRLHQQGVIKQVLATRLPPCRNGIRDPCRCPGCEPSRA
jgi:hypothetical protein